MEVPSRSCFFQVIMQIVICLLGLKKKVIIKGSWGKRLRLRAIVCSLLDLCVKGLAVLHLPFMPLYSSSTYLGFTSFFLSWFSAPLILVLYTDLIASDFMPHCHGILGKREMSVI